MTVELAAGKQFTTSLALQWLLHKAYPGWKKLTPKGNLSKDLREVKTQSLKNFYVYHYNTNYLAVSLSRASELAQNVFLYTQ